MQQIKKRRVVWLWVISLIRRINLFVKAPELSDFFILVFFVSSFFSLTFCFVRFNKKNSWHWSWYIGWSFFVVIDLSSWIRNKILSLFSVTDSYYFSFYIITCFFYFVVIFVFVVWKKSKLLWLTLCDFSRKYLAFEC